MTRKARYVIEGYLTDALMYMIYFSLGSMETVRVGFIMGALNNLDVLVADIQKIFLEAPTMENTVFYVQDEWKSDKDKVVVVVRELYGHKNSALKFRNCLAEALSNKLGFKSSQADSDLWYRPMPDTNGFE
uniref:Uncharacterized protein n=1 Tax=Eucampia antarctica TaxID=49252 RepID=A0A7S2R320_9STRA|mmetsp:Transcript_15269/g.14723  ORF Transcript_15269/g.14723 Transcript_15269/m.14723 type:complete len:131 (+) Transcript_15269:171-563(+)